MATVTPSTTAITDRLSRRFSPLELRALIDAGLFGPDEQPVLRHGAIVDPATGEPRRFTTNDLDRMDDLGLFGDDDPIELLDGEIFLMARVKSPHAATVNRVANLLKEQLGRRVIVTTQTPIPVDATSEPQPDVALARPRDDYYQSGHPTPADLFLVVEVMDSSVPHDHAVKLPLYAEAGIPELWLVHLPGDVIEVYRGPENGGYKDQQVLRRGQTIAPAASPDAVLAVEAILGPSGLRT